MGKFIKDFQTFVNESYKYEYDGKFFDTKQQKAAYIKNKKSHEDALRRKDEDEKTRKPREFICKSCHKPFTKEMTDHEFSNEKNHPKYCSRSCANKREITDEIKSKISQAVKKRIEQKKKDIEQKKKDEVKDIQITSERKPSKSEKICVVCKTPFVSNSRGRKTCSDGCKEYFRIHRKDFLSDETIQKLRNAGLKSSSIQAETRRSKNEIYFYELCKNEFKNVTHNENIFNGWDADVLIYDYRVAVLWNGNWHYKPIKKGSSLSQIQNRDKIKVKEIINCGWIPYIIEDKGKYNKQFVEDKFKDFIEFIETIK